MGSRVGKVYLVGAGPGAIDLITVRAVECLSRADSVIYDYLVNPDLLNFAPAGAVRILARRKDGNRKPMVQAQLNAMLIERARSGDTVVRLKGGDPFIFGRGGEEAEALARAKIPFEVVPGVTSAIAVPAFAGIPLTHRKHGSFVAFVTGHEDDSKPARSRVPWKELARAIKAGGTIVFLMATGRMRETLSRLAAAGLPPKTPAAAIEWGTTAAQQTVSAEVGTLAVQCERANLRSPATIVVGECVGLRSELKWFEKLPLFGKRIVITRPRETGAAFARELRALGAEAIEFPTIETRPPASYAALDRALRRLSGFDWVIFTSANGVEAFISRLRTRRNDIRELGSASICAIGPATAERLAEFGLRVVAIPTEYRAEAIIPAIGKKKIQGARILIPRAQVAREVLPELLRKEGAREVVIAPVYRTVKPPDADSDRIRSLVEAGQLDLVTFTSSSTVINFCDLVGDISRSVSAAVIGPITAETAREHGLDVVVEASQFTVPALVRSIVSHFNRSHQAG